MNVNLLEEIRELYESKKEDIRNRMFGLGAGEEMLEKLELFFELHI